MVIYTGFPYFLYFHVQGRYQYETIPALYIRSSVHLEIDNFLIIVIYTGFPYVLYFHVPLRYRHETTPGLESKYKSSN